MLGYMLTTVADVNGENWHLRTAGTHVVEGSAMSSRTRDALLAIDELRAHNFNRHRSHQLGEPDVSWADIILASEVANVNFVRAQFPLSAHKCVQFQLLVRAARAGSSAVELLAPLVDRDPVAQFDIVDPAGGDQAVYQQVAQQLWALSKEFAVLAAHAD